MLCLWQMRPLGLAWTQAYSGMWFLASAFVPGWILLGKSLQMDAHTCMLRLLSSSYIPVISNPLCLLLTPLWFTKQLLWLHSPPAPTRPFTSCLVSQLFPLTLFSPYLHLFVSPAILLCPCPRKIPLPMQSSLASCTQSGCDGNHYSNSNGRRNYVHNRSNDHILCTRDGVVQLLEQARGWLSSFF